MVTARLAAPIVFGGGYLTLDARLAALIFERTGDVGAARGSVPLARTDGLFHASAAVCEAVETRPVSFVANLRADHALDPDLLLKNRDGKVRRKIGRTRRQDFGAVMNACTAVCALYVCDDRHRRLGRFAPPRFRFEDGWAEGGRVEVVLSKIERETRRCAKRR